MSKIIFILVLCFSLLTIPFCKEVSSQKWEERKEKHKKDAIDSTIVAGGAFVGGAASACAGGCLGVAGAVGAVTCGAVEANKAIESYNKARYCAKKAEEQKHIEEKNKRKK